MISKYFWTKFAVCFWQAREFRYTFFGATNRFLGKNREN